jgi:hypothetical protein
MPKKRRKKQKEKPPAPTFLQRRSTKWLFAAIITLAIGIGVGVLGNVVNDGDDSAAPTPTAVFEP